MADYPSIDQTIDSSREYRDGRIVERTAGGTARARVDWSAIKSRFLLIHIVTAADAATILAHWAAHPDASFTLTWQDGDTTHTVIYGPTGVQEQFLGGLYRRLSVELIEL